MSTTGLDLDDLMLSELHPLIHVHRDGDNFYVHILFKMDKDLPFVSPPKVTPGEKRTDPKLKDTRLIEFEVGKHSGNYHKDKYYYHIYSTTKSKIGKEENVHVVVNHEHGTHNGDGIIHWP